MYNIFNVIEGNELVTYKFNHIREAEEKARELLKDGIERDCVLICRGYKEYKRVTK